ncbi:hypothetical protein ABE42_07885 [Bacillus thuringiensis]|uniref:Uncharacterized protein n=1 Tax=Bacillus thuringiensis TaxID=1428 RepID=A0A437SIH3_BACTU|nr:hypothetical protein [Bacillus thuringiensis]MBG9579142.1 hypothetical protein [Bacillus thuringiensis]RVU62742.1 hypothetical protein BM74_19255 [Bacillus thuringiensis]
MQMKCMVDKFDIAHAFFSFHDKKEGGEKRYICHIERIRGLQYKNYIVCSSSNLSMHYDLVIYTKK